MASYAVVETGGKQYRVEKGDTLLVDRLPEAEEGDKIELRPVAFRDKQMVLGDDLAKAKVEAKVVGHERGPKLRIFKYRPKKGYRRRAGHRSELTRLEVTELKLLQRKPAGSGTKSATKRSTGSRSTAKSSGRSSSSRKKPAAKKETKKDGS
jgi:large subunit ribosomal protein L21